MPTDPSPLLPAAPSDAPQPLSAPALDAALAPDALAATIAALAEGRLDTAALALGVRERLVADAAGLQAFAAWPEPAALAAEARAAAARGPLHGLPVAVKDIIDVAGLPTGCGSPLRAGHRPAADAAVVAALRQAGGVVVGKSATTEMAFLEPSPTGNPRAPGRTPGGSSSGSAAAVAAGLVPFALGTQTGGSVVRPAAYCGVVGMKPSLGLLPTAGTACFSWSLDTVGVFAARVDGARRLLEALTGRRWARTDPSRPWRIAVVDGRPWDEASAAMQDALGKAAARLAAAGHAVTPTRLGAWAPALFEVHAAIQGREASACLGPLRAARGDAMSATLRGYLDEAAGIDAAAYAAAWQRLAAERPAALAAFDGVDALLMPSAPDAAPPLSARSTGPSTLNRVWTLLGTPCVNVPGLATAEGAPLGLQVVTPPGADALALAVAEDLEALLAAG
ncbi:amidase family protein [Piscinibacter sakaiensis]|uniref:Putative amidase n=1 Tax=Piscinibacter sakaiensis TaxID=1547922 RepID=A0A0K8P475_PISS1|nr:amidase [Piscinibacter sakaiensis]GAP37443.1 putative amidase [Piscinibacter sakaiensis]